MIVITVNGMKVAYEKTLIEIASDMSTFLHEFAPARLEIIGYRKTCGCGKSYNRREFCELPLVGTGGDEVEAQELRNCYCNSTLAWPMRSTDQETIAEILKQTA